VATKLTSTSRQKLETSPRYQKSMSSEEVTVSILESSCQVSTIIGKQVRIRGTI